MNKYFIDLTRFNKKNELRNSEKLKIIEEKLKIVETPEEADFILCIGGDGTLLSSVSTYKSYNKPFIGIHGGTVGYYMQDLLKGNMINEKDLNILKDGNLYIDKFPLIEIEAESEDGELFKEYCFGDCWFERESSPSLNYKICLKTKTGTLFSNEDKRISGDGMLFSTAIGSTGYAKKILDFIMPFGSDDILVAPMNSTIDKNKLVGFNMDKESEIKIDLYDVDFRTPRLLVDGEIIKNSKGERFVPKKVTIRSAKDKYVRLAYIHNNFFERKSFNYLIN